MSGAGAANGREGMTGARRCGACRRGLGESVGCRACHDRRVAAAEVAAEAVERAREAEAKREARFERRAQR